MSELSIASIVATGKIGREFELEALGNDIDAYSCDYSPDEHPGLYVKFNEDGPTITIFTSGSINIRGASSKEVLYENKSLVENSISGLGIEETISDFQITNIVFTSDLGENINLNEIAIKLGLENVEYEPEQFPGLVYRLDQGVILIFSSGRLVLTGFTNIEDAKQAFNTLSTDLNED
jgi:transcription initiation factor TFIID TATA-box-binding protein